MKTKQISMVFAATIVLSGQLQAAVTKSPTRFDCREPVRIHKYQVAPKQWAVKFIKVCPHKDKQAEGKCVTNLWGQMRCTE